MQQRKNHFEHCLTPMFFVSVLLMHFSVIHNLVFNFKLEKLMASRIKSASLVQDTIAVDYVKNLDSTNNTK